MKVIKYLPILAICMMTTGCNSSKQQTLTSGIDLANLDTLALPGADFYLYACGGWMKNHPLTDEFHVSVLSICWPKTIGNNFADLLKN